MFGALNYDVGAPISSGQTPVVASTGPTGTYQFAMSADGDSPISDSGAGTWTYNSGGGYWALTDASKNWTANEWAGLSISDSAGNTYTVAASTSDTIDCFISSSSPTPKNGAYCVAKYIDTVFARQYSNALVLYKPSAGAAQNGITVASATIANAGSGYTNDDIVTVQGGAYAYGAQAEFELTVSNGVVTRATLYNGRAGNYSVFPSGPVTVTGGSGSGLRLNLTQTAGSLSTATTFTLPPSPTGSWYFLNADYNGVVSNTTPITQITLSDGEAAILATQPTSPSSGQGPVLTTPSTLPFDTVAVPYHQTIAAVGGTGNLTLSVTNIQNSIAGLVLPGSGTGSLTISGTPTAAGTETFTVTATDSLGATTSTTYSITVNGSVALGPSSLPADTVGAAYNNTITASGGTGSLTLAVTNIQNPIAGLVVPVSGTNSLAVSGTPTAAGTETFMVTATDSLGATTSTSYSLTVSGSFVLTPSGLPADTIEIPYNQTITTSGGTGSVALVVSSIQNPIAGLLLPSSGAGSLTISGTPTAAGTETFTVTATDSLGDTTSRNYSITINGSDPLMPSSLPADTINVAYHQAITATGGTGSIALVVSNIQNPISGLLLPTSGTNSLTISGTPTAVGTETFTVTATDSVGATTSDNYSITVNGAVLIGPSSLPADTVKIQYNQSITASGGTGALTLAVSNIQNAIAGLVVPSSGGSSLTISGTPMAAGTETFTVTATDSAGATTKTNYSITINGAVSIGPASLPADTTNMAYNQTITASGGTGSIGLVVSNIQNAIPGLVVPARGTGNLTISGTPTATGTETFTVTATDALGATTSTNYSITVSRLACSILGTGDFTGDGKMDVLCENTSTGGVGAWITGGSWLALGTVPLNTGWKYAGVGDFTKDGKADVLWENVNTGVVGAWITGGGWLGLGTAPLNAGWTLAAVGDFNGDGKADILWENMNTGVVGAWITGGSWLGLGTVPLNTGWKCAGVGDFTKDGKADVLWENMNTGVVGAWITGGGWLGLGTAPLNAGWTIAGLGDFNADGKADILWENTSTGVVGAWITGGGWLGLGTAPLNAGWSLASVGIFSKNGKADVLWENLDTGAVGAWMTSGGWLGLGTV